MRPAITYAHIFEPAPRHGEPEWRVGLFPLLADGIVAAPMTLLSDARRGRRGGALPR